MKLDQEKKKSKKPYEKPMLRTIELAAEEVLAVGCKLAGSGNAYGSVVSCIVNSCAGPGS
jgi:hypothetical protein